MSNTTNEVVFEEGGTIILRWTADALDMFVANDITKEEVMGLLYEALTALDDMPISPDETIPTGTFGMQSLQ